MGRELSSFVLAMCNETGSSARWPRCTRAHGVAADTRSSSSRSAQPPRPRRHPPARGSGGQPGECNRWRSTRLPSDRPLGRQAESRSRRRRADRFPDDIIAQHKRWPAAHRLRVEVGPDHHVGVLQTRGEHAGRRRDLCRSMKRAMSASPACGRGAALGVLIAQHRFPFQTSPPIPAKTAPAQPKWAERGRLELVWKPLKISPTPRLPVRLGRPAPRGVLAAVRSSPASRSRPLPRASGAILRPRAIGPFPRRRLRS